MQTRRDFVKAGGAFAAALAASGADAAFTRSMIGARGVICGGSGGNAEPMTCNLQASVCSALTIPINGLGNVSYGGWVKNIGGYPNGGPPGWIEGSGGWGGTYFAINSNTIEIRFGSGSSNTKKQWTFTSPGDVWAHYYFVREGSYMRFYYNGQLFGSQSCGTGKLKNNEDNFVLARQRTKKLSIVGLSFFSRALSLSEIQTAMKAVVIDKTKAPYTSGLVMGVNCTEGKGDRIYELVSGNHTTLNPAPTWDVEIPAQS